MNTTAQKTISGIFNPALKTKRELENYCRDLVIKQADLVELILQVQAGLHPYRYASRFFDKIPPHLHPTVEERSALASNGLGPLKGQAQTAINKFHQILRDRRHFAAHLFYTPSGRYWYLFYFDQRDIAKRDNHSSLGPHIHLVTDLWPNLALEAVWNKVQLGDMKFRNKLHIRYLDERDRSSSVPSKTRGDI